MLYTTTWGIGLLTPVESFQNPSYRLLSGLITEHWLGISLLALAAMHGIGVLSLRTRVRKVGLAGQMMAWSAIAVLGWLSSPSSLGWWHFSLMAGVAFWCWVRLRRYA